MRQIRFRGKNKDTGKWNYGGIIIYPRSQDCFIQEYGINHRDEETAASKPVESETVGQFTGLHDQDGNEIWEGDIIEMDYGLAEVYWKEGRFMIDFGLDADQLNYHHMSSIVKGNIHDNSELINQNQ